MSLGVTDLPKIEAEILDAVKSLNGALPIIVAYWRYTRGFKPVLADQATSAIMRGMQAKGLLTFKDVYEVVKQE